VPRVHHPGPVEAGQAGTLAVDVRGLVKSYSGTRAVKGIDLAIPAGEVFALLGPNGAGKTTTVEILEGYRTRDQGEAASLVWIPTVSARG
jgi:ABC-2 type transport system ATP-binding protein